MNFEDKTSAFPLIDILDHQILMHRDVHFGRKFSYMLDYYREEKKGCQPEFSIRQIEKLQQIQSAAEQDISPMILDVGEKKEVAAALKTYEQLQKIYEEKKPTDNAFILANLILSEEEYPEKEIEAVVAKGKEIVPELIAFFNCDDFYNPLFPGYGWAPLHFVQCLGKIGDEKAIESLFHALQKGEFELEDAILTALSQMGDKARELLIKRMVTEPITLENERAAIALGSFTHHEDIGKSALALLLSNKVSLDSVFASYLVLLCSHLENPKDIASLKELSRSDQIPTELLAEIKISLMELEKKRENKPK